MELLGRAIRLAQQVCRYRFLYERQVVWFIAVVLVVIVRGGAERTTRLRRDRLSVKITTV